MLFRASMLAVLLATALTISGLWLFPATAAQSPANQAVPKTRAELLVFEVDGCAYCMIFRRDVAPAYRRSPRARSVPMRFIDVNKADVSKLELSTPLKVVPTVVLMIDGRESDRITGYMGPEPFFHMISSLMRH